MKPIAIFALIAAWFAVSSTAVAEPKSQYGDFSAAADSHQAYLDYINGLEMIQVEAGAELQQAIEAIPVDCVRVPLLIDVSVACCLTRRHSRESGNPAQRTSLKRAFWMPAFAGMTKAA